MVTNKIKRIVSWGMAVSLAILMVIPFSTAVSAAGVALTVGVPATVVAGNTFEVDINIGTVTNLNGFQFDLTYDNSVIQVAGEESGSAVSSGLVGATAMPLNMWGFVPSGTPGCVRAFGHLFGASGATGQGYLARIQFVAVGAAGMNSALSISNVELSNAAGNEIAAIAGGASITINGAGDLTPPSVISVSPAASASAVPVITAVTATFSEAVKDTSLTSSTFTLMNGLTAVAGSVSSSANSATFTPAEALAYGVTYIATLSIGITDLAGNALEDDYFWSFTTGGQPADDPPVSINPSAANVTRGNIYVATIDIGAVSNFNAYQFDLTYDNSVIQVSGDEGGSAVSNGLIGSKTVPLAMWGFLPSGQPGCIRVLGHLPGVTSATGQGYLARIQFEVTGAAGQSSNVTLSNVALYDGAGDVIPASPAGGVVNVVAVPLEMLTTSLVDGMAGSNYNAALLAAGGQSPYSWSAVGLPSGLTLSSSGAISGQPALSGNFSVNVTLTDSFSPANTITRTMALHIYPALQITTASLADGTTAMAYSATLGATGGKGAYTWSASGLPAGLTLSSAGVISGQSSLAVNSIVTLTVTDSFSPPYSVSKTISLKILLTGDANGDGSITMGDVTKVERIILGLDVTTLSADANGDGQVNMGDVTRIERLILGM